MKKPLLLLTLLITLIPLSFSQNRNVARGATPGELYLTGVWHGTYGPLGPPFYTDMSLAVYRLTENGKKLTVQYDSDYFTTPYLTMLPAVILADATPGVLYGRNTYYPPPDYSYTHTGLWVSFNYGKNWIFRKEDPGSLMYFSANVSGVIYNGAWEGMLKSTNYGQDFFILEDAVTLGYESGLIDCEFFRLNGRGLHHTFDCYQNYTDITIDEEFVYGLVGVQPDVFRGGLPGEVYVTSRFPDHTYKVSFSADTGHTFRHVYITDYDNQSGYYSPNEPFFMSDREPGVFYIYRSTLVEDFNPWGEHVKLCIEYYRDYGEILEAIFCHDLTRDYEYEEVICNNTTYLESNLHQHSIQLEWSNSADNEFIRGYHVFRNNVRITNQMLTSTTYLDENLPNGDYEYYVRTYYVEGCASDASNYVEEAVGVGVAELRIMNYELRVHPNPTTGELTITTIPRWRGQGVEQLRLTSVEVFDVYGRKLTTNHLSLTTINIAHLPAGLYFVKITTEEGVITKKVIKQ